MLQETLDRFQPRLKALGFEAQLLLPVEPLLAGLVLIYVLSVRWVFARRALRDARAEFVLFAALGLVGLLLNALTLFVGTALGLALPLAKTASAGIGFVANFVTRKVLLFSVAKA